MSQPNLTPRQIKRLRDALLHGYDDILHPEIEGYGITEEDLHRIQQRRAEFIRAMESSYELHVFADNYNWDDGIEALREVIRHPLCDLGTAMMI